MYQYKAVLKSSKKIVAEGHSVDDMEKQIIHYKRQQKSGEHTKMNEPIEIIHMKRDKVHGTSEEVLIKIV